MDMQPLEPSPELSAAERRQKNRKIVFRGERQKQKAKTVISGQFAEEPPLLMMSSVSGEDSVPSSPARRHLLTSGGKQFANSSSSSPGINSRGKKHSKKASTPRVGMSSKITRALFRDRKASNGKSFAKMPPDSMASDSYGYHFRRSAGSPFHAVVPGNTKALSMVFDPVNSRVPSFDNTSTSSGRLPSPAPMEAPVKSNVWGAKRPPLSPPRPSAKRSTGPCILVDETQQISSNGNVSSLSMGSLSSLKSLPSPPTRTMAGGSIPVIPPPKAPSSVASSIASSLNFSESHGSFNEHNNLYSGNSLVGVRIGLTPTKSEDTSAPAGDVEEKNGKNSPNCNDNDIDSISDLVQERLLERLEQAVYQTPKGASVPSSISHKKIPSIKPPPSLPPKAPRTAANATTNGTNPNDASTPSMEAPSSASAAQTQSQSQGQAQTSLKQHEARLLQGGEFLNESTESHSIPSGPGPADLALKLLKRLEAAQADTQLMTDHYDQDPPIAMTQTTSFGSSVITVTTRDQPNPLPRRHSHGSSTYEAFMIAEKEPEADRHQHNSNSNHNPSRPSTKSVPLMEEEDQVQDKEDELVVSTVQTQDEEDELVVSTVQEQDEEDELVVSTVQEQDEEDEVEAVQREDQSERSATKLCYLYSQDKEFENSILSGGTVSVSATHGNTSVLPLPSSPNPKTLYRSDAIDAFLEQTGCSQDHCMGGAATKVAGVGKADAQTNAEGVASPNPAEDDNIKENEEPSIVSDDFLNMMTSGCTGVPSPVTKEVVKEKLVALEAGWSGFRSQVNEQFHSLEESWQGWNLNSLLQFNSPKKAEATAAAENKEEQDAEPVPESAAAMTPTTMGSTTVLTTPGTMSTVKDQHMGDLSDQHNDMITPKHMFQEEEDPLQEVELIQAESSVVGLMKSPMSTEAEDEQVVLGVVRELEKQRLMTKGMRAAADDDDLSVDIEKIVIGSTEHDVPLSLKNSLADISMIADANNNTSGSSSNSQRPKATLDASRDDSEGGKVILDAAEWDPVDSSAADEDEVHESVQTVNDNEGPLHRHDTETTDYHKPRAQNKVGGLVKVFKRKNWGKKSPKSVLAEF